MSDPMDELPDGFVSSSNPYLRAAAQQVAEELCRFDDDNDHRSLRLFGQAYTFTSVQQATDTMIEARFRLVRALVAFGAGERAKANIKHMVTRHLVGDA